MRRIVTGILSALALVAALYASFGVIFIVLSRGEFDPPGIVVAISSLASGLLASLLSTAALGAFIRPRRLWALLVAALAAFQFGAFGLFAISLSSIQRQRSFIEIYPQPPEYRSPALPIAMAALGFCLLAATAAWVLARSRGRPLTERAWLSLAAVGAAVPFANVFAIAGIGIAANRWTAAPPTPAEALRQTRRTGSLTLSKG